MIEFKMKINSSLNRHTDVHKAAIKLIISVTHVIGKSEVFICYVCFFMRVGRE